MNAYPHPTGFGRCSDSGDLPFRIAIIGFLGLVGLGSAVAIMGLYIWAWRSRNRALAVAGVTLLTIIVVWRFVTFLLASHAYEP
jgi:hypothetical protein